MTFLALTSTGGSKKPESAPSSRESPRSVGGGLVFALCEQKGGKTMIQPIDLSRRDRQNVKSTVAKVLNTSERELSNHNQVRRDCDSLGSGVEAVSNHDLKRAVSVSHSRLCAPSDSAQEIPLVSKNLHHHTNSDNRCRHKTRATGTTACLLTPFEPSYATNENHRNDIKPLSTAKSLVTTSHQGANRSKEGIVDANSNMGHLKQPLEINSTARCRPRSATIAMKKATLNPQTEADQTALANAVREYEWATWRLYDRIISHRQKHQDLHERLAQTNDCYFEEAYRNASIAEDADLPVKNQSSELADEGIFEMDL